MKIEEGFKPNSQKEQALQQAEEEAISGSKRPQVAAFSAKQLEELRQLDAELETVGSDLSGDLSKMRGYVAELEQVLAELENLPHEPLARDHSEVLEKHLGEAVAAARSGRPHEAVRSLQRAIQGAHGLLARLQHSS